MARIRADYVFGTISTPGGLTTAATTLDSPALARLPVVASPDIAPVILHNPAAGIFEVVHVTAHTAGATTATMLRAQEGTTARVWLEGDAWLHGPTIEDDNGVGINAQTGTTYTLVRNDAGQLVTLNNASAITLTVPPNSSVAFPIGTVITGMQTGAGQVTIAQGSGVTVNATPGLKVAAQYGSFALLKTGTNTWSAVGRLAA